MASAANQTDIEKSLNDDLIGFSNHTTVKASKTIEITQDNYDSHFDFRTGKILSSSTISPGDTVKIGNISNRAFVIDRPLTIMPISSSDKITNGFIHLIKGSDGSSVLNLTINNTKGTLTLGGVTVGQLHGIWISNSNDNYIAYNTIRIANTGGVYAMPMGWSSNNRILYNDLKTYVSSVIIMGQCHYNLISHNSLEVLSYSDLSVTNLIYFNPFGHADYSGTALCKGNIISYNYLKGFCSMPMSIILQMTYESHDGTVVANNTIFKGSFGVNLMGSNITVYGNTINNSAVGIAVNGDNFTVYNNQITGDSQSIGLSAFSMTNKTAEVSNNTITFTDVSVGIQIADNVYAHDNRVTIAGYGIGMYLSGNNATAYKNTIKNNHDAGISIMGSFNNVYYNAVTTNNIGVSIPAQSTGLRYYSNRITQNRIISDSYGISIIGLVYNTTMLDNIIETNASVGIFKQITDEISNTEEDNIVNGVILNSTAIVINDGNFNKYFTPEGYLKYELGVNRNKVIILTFLSNKNLIFTETIRVISNRMNNLLYNVTITLTQDADGSLVEGFTFTNQAREAIIVDGVDDVVINRNNITDVFKSSSLANSAILIQGVCKNATISANNIYVNSKINYTYAINAPAISPQTRQTNNKLSSGFTIRDNNIIMISTGVCEAIYTDSLNSSSFISNRINIISNDYAYGIALANIIGKLSDMSISLNEIIIYSDKMAYLIELHMVDNSNVSNNTLYSQSNGVFGIGTYDSYNISIANNTLSIFGGDLSNIKSVSDVLGIGNAAIAVIKNGDNTTVYNNLIHTNALKPILLVNTSDIDEDFNTYVVDDYNYEVFFNKTTGNLNFDIKNKLLLNLSKNQLVKIDKTLIISSYMNIPSKIRLIITKQGNASLISNISLVNSTVKLNDTFDILIINSTFTDSFVNICGGLGNVISKCVFSSYLDDSRMVGLNETSLNVIKDSSFYVNSKNAEIIVIDTSKDNVVSNNTFKAFGGDIDYVYSNNSRDNITNNLFEGIGDKIHVYYGIRSYECMILDNRIFINGSGGLNNQAAVYLADNSFGNVISQNYIVSCSKTADEYAVVVLSDVASKVVRNYLISANESKIADGAVYAPSSEVHSNTPSDVYVSGVNGSDITGDGSQSKPYASISNAVLNALNHSTIHVADGTYTESNILIDKDISIKSINPGKVFLNAGFKQLFNITKNGVLSISGIGISDAFNVDGGSVFINNGILTIEDCVISNCSSYFDNSYPNFVDITYDGNGEIDEAYTVDCSHTGMGGAILNNGQLKINSSVFYNNLGHCGGVIADFGKTSIVSSLFYNNLGVHGGVIYTNSKNKLDIKDSVFKNNTALTTLDYCAIRLYTTAWSITEGNIHNMKSICGDVIGAGGAIYTNTYMNIENSQFVDNSARSGGAIYSKSASASLEIKNSTFTNNRANDTRRSLGNISLDAFDFTAESNGGAIFGDYDKLYITSSGFYKNQANKNGGAIKATANDGKILDSIFDSNIAGIGGGALDISKNFIIMRTVISNNSARYAGAVSYTSYTYYGHIQDNLNIYNSTISYNRALNDGGAFTISSGNVVVHDSNIIGNTAPSGSTISTSSSSYSIDMRYNYWGRASGPDDSVWSVNNNNFKPWARQWIDWNPKSTSPIIGPVDPQDDDGGNNPKPNPGGGHNTNPSSTGSNTHTGSTIGQNGAGNGNWKYSGDGDGTNSGYGGIGNGHGGHYSLGGTGLYGGQNIKGNSKSNIPSFGESQSDDENHQNSQSRTNSSMFNSNLATTGSVSNAMSASSASQGGADGGGSSGGESVSKAYEISQKIDELLDDGYSTLMSVIFAITGVFLLIVGYRRNKKEDY